MDEKYEGTVIWFNNKPGYGFIARDGEKDLFVHFSDVLSEGFKTLKKDQRVKFGIGMNNKGEPKAIDVEVLDEK